MAGYIIFIIVGLGLIYLGKTTRLKGFENLNIKRVIEKNRVKIGEEFKITTIIENNKFLPISFLILKEYMPKSIEYISSFKVSKAEDNFVYESKYTIGSYERVKRTYKVVANKRGTYMINNLGCTIGDIFGLSYDNKEIEDPKEILVYPKEININKIVFNNKGLQGDVIIKRWIYEDPLFIKGVRDYTPESRMKDVHWKASSKLGKLMVKEYDPTSDMQFNIILNVQCGDPCFASINMTLIEKSIEVAAAIAKGILVNGIPVGIDTNAMLTSFDGMCKFKIEPSLNSLDKILQFCARVGYDAKVPLYEYLKRNVKNFSTNSTYILITSYLDEECENILSKLARSGYSIKVIDMTVNKNLNPIRGIERVAYEGVMQ